MSYSDSTEKKNTLKKYKNAREIYSSHSWTDPTFSLDEFFRYNDKKNTSPHDYFNCL